MELISTDDDDLVVIADKQLRKISETNEVNIHSSILLDESLFSRLGGACDQLLLTHIFTFLSAKDLSSLGATSKYFMLMASNPILWDNLIRADFSSEGLVTVDRRRAAAFQPRTSTSDPFLVNFLLTKEDYSRCHQELQTRRVTSTADDIAYSELIASNAKLTWWESFLDISLFRVLLTLPLVAIFASLLLLCLHFDGIGIPIWVCASPILFLFFYTFLCILLSIFIYQNRFDDNNLDLWTHLNSPIKSYYLQIVNGSKPRTYFTILGIILSLLQVLLISVKLSIHVTPHSILNNLEWGVVFLPVWCILTMFCMTPVVGLIRDKGLFGLLTLVVWIPLFIILVCLVVKLDGEDNHTKEANIRLALIFMPLWIIEGFVMLGTLTMVIGGYLK